MSVRTLFTRPGYRYLFVGGSVYVLELAVIYVAGHLGASAVWSVTLSFTVGLIVSFVLQKFFTFGDHRLKRHIVLPQLIAVTLLVLWNLGFTILLTTLLQTVMPPMLTRTIALGITTIWNYYLYRTRIFNVQKDTILFD